MHLISLRSVLVGRIDYGCMDWGIRGSLRVSHIGGIGRHDDLRALGRGKSAGEGLIAAGEGGPARPQSCSERPCVGSSHGHGGEGRVGVSMAMTSLIEMEMSFLDLKVSIWWFLGKRLGIFLLN